MDLWTNIRQTRLNVWSLEEMNQPNTSSRVDKPQPWAKQQSVGGNWVFGGVGFGFTGVGVLIKSIKISSKISSNDSLISEATAWIFYFITPIPVTFFPSTSVMIFISRSLISLYVLHNCKKGVSYCHKNLNFIIHFFIFSFDSFCNFLILFFNSFF